MIDLTHLTGKSPQSPDIEPDTASAAYKLGKAVPMMLDMDKDQLLEAISTLRDFLPPRL